LSEGFVVLPTFVYEGKIYTVDDRLREFRHIVYGEIPEYVPFDSPKGRRMLKAYYGAHAKDRVTDLVDRFSRP
jgi:hypothetical protein